MSKRRVCYVTGTRADFGLMAGTLQKLHASAAIELRVVATGMHLSPKYGSTVDEIVAHGLTVLARIPGSVEVTSGDAMARTAGQILIGLADALSGWRPDLVLLLGDRGEMLAGAIAATVPPWAALRCVPVTAMPRLTPGEAAILLSVDSISPKSARVPLR